MADIEKLVRETVERLSAERREERTAKRIDFISLTDAKYLAGKVEEKAREMGVRAVVAIADEGANLKLLECMDDSYIASRDIAVNKAYTCVSLKMSTAKLSRLAQPGAPLYGVQHTNGGRIVIFGGGEPLCLRGKVVGAIGVSGGSAEQDTALAEYAVQVFLKAFI